MKVLFAALVSTSLLFGCTEDKTEAKAQAKETGKQMAQTVKTSITGETYTFTDTNGVKATLSFKDGRIAGKVVNNYFGTYTMTGNTIKAGPLASTMMMGPEASMKTERKIMQFLNGTFTYQVKGTDLILTKGSDTITFKRN